MVGATSATVEWRAVSGTSGGDFRLKLGKQASWRTKLSTRSLGKWSRQQKAAASTAERCWSGSSASVEL
jgi:hypothetical protein